MTLRSHKKKAGGGGRHVALHHLRNMSIQLCLLSFEHLSVALYQQYGSLPRITESSDPWVAELSRVDDPESIEAARQKPLGVEWLEYVDELDRVCTGRCYHRTVTVHVSKKPTLKLKHPYRRPGQEDPVVSKRRKEAVVEVQASSRLCDMFENARAANGQQFEYQKQRYTVVDSSRGESSDIAHRRVEYFAEIAIEMLQNDELEHGSNLKYFMMDPNPRIKLL